MIFISLLLIRVDWQFLFTEVKKEEITDNSYQRGEEEKKEQRYKKKKQMNVTCVLNETVVGALRARQSS